MATNALIARTEGEGFAGRLTNFDGDPKEMGAAIFELARQMGGIEAVARVLVDEHGGWGSIRPGIDAAYLAAHHLEVPEEAELVEGVGVAYTDVDGAPVRGKAGQRLAKTGFRPQWVYALDGKAERMDVYEVLEGVPGLVGQVEMDGVEPNWGEIECGANLERCRHAVYVHAERFGIDPQHPSARMNIAQFTGEAPLEEWLATGAVYQGKSYEFTGNGRRGEDDHWYMEARVGANASRVWLDMDKPGVKRVYPKRRRELLATGELDLATMAEQVEGGVLV